MSAQGFGASFKALFGWWAHQDSNLEPRDYESTEGANVNPCSD